MITIRTAQVEALSEVSRSAFVDKLSAQLGLPPAEVTPHVAAALARGLTREVDVSRYVDLTLRQGKPGGTSLPSALARELSERTVGGTMEPCLQEQRVHWIQIELVGEDDCPIPGEAFRIALPDGRVVTGSLDDEGKARVENIINAGYCQISFPNLDKDAWEPLAG